MILTRHHQIEHASIEPGGPVSRTMDHLARVLWYSTTWSKTQARKRWVVEHMIQCEGVPESDIRDIRFLPDRDVVVVRLHNWRHFKVNGIHMTWHERGA